MASDAEKLKKYFAKLIKDEFDGEVSVKFERGEIVNIVCTRYTHISELE